MLNSIKYILFLFVFLFFASCLFSQEIEVENLLENEAEFSDSHELMELLSQLENNPININSASIDVLTLIPWITDQLAIKIIDYRAKIGGLNSLDQLKEIDEFNPALLPILEKYLTAQKPFSFKKFSMRLKNRAIRKIQESKGFAEGNYANSPSKFYNRLIVDYDESFRLGGLLEKDAGEQNINDFSSYFIKYVNQRYGHTLILGNYYLEFGRGLIFWSPYSKYKSPNPVYTTKKRSRGIVEYTMVDENASLFGVATKICAKNYQMYAFYSSQKIDANIDSATNTVKTFYSAGFHRTENEILKNDQLREDLYGARIQFTPVPTFKIGTTGYLSKFDKFLDNPDNIRNRYVFRGNKNSVIGIDADLFFRNINFFGEWSRSKNGGFGYIAGAAFDSRVIDFSLLYRHYSKDYQNLHGNGFGEAGYQPQNEKGLYFGFDYRKSKTLIFSLFLDYYKFPWRTYTLPMPATGKSLVGAVRYKPIKKLWLYAHLKTSVKSKSVNSSNNFGLSNQIMLPRNQYNIRFQLDYSASQKLKIRHRIEKSFINYQKYFDTSVNIPNEYGGLLIYQEISFKIKSAVTLSTRYTFFDTDDYESRLYQFERDVPGVLTNQMLYGKGTKWYLFARFQMGSFFKFYVKYSSTQYDNQEFIGTQNEQIKGNRVNAVHFQLETNL